MIVLLDIVPQWALSLLLVGTKKMPTYPNKSYTLLQGLSDFWGPYFRDLDFTESFLEATQGIFGQLYLELLQTVLGTSLRHMPLFDKKYWLLFQIREDQVRFVEGQSSDEDRFHYIYRDPLSEVPSLLNKVILPTQILEVNKDYYIIKQKLAFSMNPFDIDGSGTSLSGFPVRSLQVVVPATLVHPLGLSWSSLGVLGGDILSVQAQRATPFEEIILAPNPAGLVLEASQEVFKTELRNRNVKIHVFREPFNGKQTYELTKYIKDVATDDAAIPVFPPVSPGRIFVTAVGPDWASRYVYFESIHPENDGLYRVNSITPVGGGFEIETTKPDAYIGGYGTAYLVLFDTAITGDQPTEVLDHSYIREGTFTVSGRRLHARTINGVVYPAGGAIKEGVDYIINLETGELVFITVWDPVVHPYVSYSWRLLITDFLLTYQGDWTSMTYYVYDVVKYNNSYYVCREDNFSGTFDSTKWLLYPSLFLISPAVVLRELALWAPDIEIDNGRLYLNFGYLLGIQRESSELYRDLLRGVSQLLLLGPTPERIESALNVIAGFPVIRDEGEVLTSYSSGCIPLGETSLETITGDVTLGTGGHLFGLASGRDGVANSVTSEFSTASGWMDPLNDVGAIITIRRDTGEETHTVISISDDGKTAKVTPNFSADTSNLMWRLRHNVQNQVFTVDAAETTHLFTDEDLDAVVVIEDAGNECNVGVFQISSVDGPRSVHLNAPYGFMDEGGLRWRLSRTKQQEVVTSRNTYYYPLTVPMRSDLREPTNLGSLSFSAFEPLTRGIEVVDYLIDPTWWHHEVIPKELLSLTTDILSRRKVEPHFIPHVIAPRDQAVIGDPGQYIGLDESENPGITRSGPGTWFGGSWVQLAYPSPTPMASPQDVKQYISISTPPFTGAYKILEVGGGGTLLRLERFPPKEARGLSAPLPIDSRLPPLIYRRSVGFIFMDHFLKYHAFQVRIDPRLGITSEFLSAAKQIVQMAKGSCSYGFIQSFTAFEETLNLSDAVVVTAV